MSFKLHKFAFHFAFCVCVLRADNVCLRLIFHVSMHAAVFFFSLTILNTPVFIFCVFDIGSCFLIHCCIFFFSIQHLRYWFFMYVVVVKSYVINLSGMYVHVCVCIYVNIYFSFHTIIIIHTFVMLNCNFCIVWPFRGPLGRLAKV